MRPAPSLSRLLFILGTCVPLAFFAFASSTGAQAKQQSANAVMLASQPISFEPNRGQASPAAAYVARTADLAIALRPLGFDLHIGSGSGDGARMGIDFIGGNSGAEVAASDRKLSYSNYILGNDPSRWLAHVPNFGRVTYKGIYPGVDVAFYGNRERLEHDFIVAPGADYHVIRVHLDGLHDMELSDGDLKLVFPNGYLVFGKPEVYQQGAGRKEVLRGRYVLLAKNEFAFEVGEYDRTRPLVIDPVLTYSTYLADLPLFVSGVAADAAGDTFVTGMAFSSNFPTTPGAFQPSCKSCPNATDVFITKMNATGTRLVYSTLLGGSSYDQPAGIAVDKNGNAIVAGFTQSVDFPVKNPIQAVYPGTGAQYAFITSLSPDGSKLNYSSLLGSDAAPGGSPSNYVGGVAVDANGNAYVSGTTDSPVFPVTALNLIPSPPVYPMEVVFVTKFLPTGALGYSALLGNVAPQNGGGGLIGIEGIAVDPLGSAYIAGSGGSLWPTTAGAYQTIIPGVTPYAAPFVAKLSPDGSTLDYSTFLGDGGTPAGIAVNASGEAFITGDYATNNFPTTPNAFQKSLGSNVCCASFLTEFNAAGSQLLYSSYFTGSVTTSQGTTSTTSIALDGNGRIWLSGTTGDPQFARMLPLQSLPASSSDGIPTTTGFISRFDPTGAALTFSSYFGGTVQGGTVTGVAIDSNNQAHIAGTTGSGLFTTTGAYLSSVTSAPPNVQYTYGYAAVIDADVAAPSVCFNSQGLFFGYVKVGASSALTLTVTNCGNSQLSIGNITSSNSGFTVPAASNGCQQPVAVNASCTFTVAFAPTSLGAVGSILTIASNTPVPSVDLPLNGIGALPQIQVQTTSVAFDPQFLGQTSPSQVLFIGNAGGVPLHIDLAHTTVSASFGYTQTGCDQPIYLGGYCALFLTFTPAAAGIQTGTVNIASDDPANPVVAVSLTGIGYSSYPAPALTGLNPPTLPIGSASVTVQVYGSNFFPASVVYAAGQAQVTTYQSATILTATLDASLLANTREISLTVFNPAPGGGESTPLIVTIYESIPMAASALLYDPITKLLYAAIHAGAANNPNSIAVIDPVAGKVSQYIPVGNDPRKLALSSDGSYLYVALNGDHAIQRLNMSNLTVDQTFALPVDSSFGLLTAADLKVVPGSPTSVVVALYRVASPAEDGIALYNNGTLVNWLPNDGVIASVAVDSFDFAGTPPAIYTLPRSLSGSFGVLTIGSSGIQVQSTGTPGTTQQATGSILVSDGTLLYTNSGQIWNPSPQTLVGTYSPSLLYVPSVVPDNSLGRTFFLDPYASYSQYQATSVEAYDQKSLAMISSVPFLSVYGPDATSLTRWGSDGFAFVVNDFVTTGGSDQVILFRSSISVAATGQNPAPVLTSLDTSSVVSGAANFTLSVTGSGFINGSVVQWNGSALTTTFVSGTRLTANVTAADIAHPGAALIAVSNPAPGGGTSSPLSFTITPSPAAATLTTASLAFGSQTVGAITPAQSVTLMNTGASPLSITGVQITGDFAQTNNCPSALTALANCAISVTFTPSANGPRQASLTITDNAANSPQTVALSGTGTAPDFSFGTGGSNTSTATVAAGQTASYQLSLVPGTNFSGTVTLSCTQVPLNAQCAVSPSSLPVTNGKAAAFTVTITTGPASAAQVTQLQLVLGVCCVGCLFALPLFSSTRRTTRLSTARSIGLTLVVLACLVIATGILGCGGGSPSLQPTSLTTPPGTYSLQIVAAEGTVTHSESITLVVH